MDPTPNFIMVATTASVLLKVLIDGIKIGVDLPRWGVPLIALVLSPLITWAVLVYGEAWTSTARDYAGLGLASIMTFGLAAGVTELQRHAQARTAARGEGPTTP